MTHNGRMDTERDMTAALIVRDGKLLLVHNVKHGLRIEPPGGKVHPGEGLEESVVREVAEELGVDVRVTGLFGEYPTHTPEGLFVVSMYLCDIISGEPRICEPEKIPEFGWYSYDELLELRDTGALVPNMCAALDGLRGLLG